MTSNVSTDLDDVIGEPLLAKIAFRTNRLPWYMRHVGQGTIGEFILLAPFLAYHYLRPAKPTDTEALLDYSGLIHCVRTREHLFFVAHQEIGQPVQHVLRSFPLSALQSCSYEHSNATLIRFQFDSGECLTLHFEGDWNDLAAFTAPLCSIAEPDTKHS